MGAFLGSLCSPHDKKSRGLAYSEGTGACSDLSLSGVAPSNTQYEGPDLELPAEWITDCFFNHSACAERRQSTYRPTRLIDIGSGTELLQARLVESSPTDPPVKYLALSYCWGSNMPVAAKTYLSTLSAHKTSLDLNALPRTFLHFFQVAKRLYARYVWIDALCIIQDSDIDWQRESACMGKIYLNAVCTITAESSRDCRGGMWLESGPVGRRFKTQEERTRTFLLTSDQRIWKSPLQTRGWALQERDLSPRVLHFTYAHLFWECRTLRTDCTALLGGCEGVIESDSSIRASGSEWKSSRPRAFDMSRPTDSPMDLHLQDRTRRLKIWRETIEDYSGRSFTRLSDRLPALSGLATEIEEILGYEYVAGLWTEDLLLGLLWTHDHTRRSKNRDRDPLERYEAPSWSWASYRGAISYEDAQQALLNKDHRPSWFSAQVLEAKTIPEGLDPKGRLVGGFIRLKGRVRWFRDASSTEPMNEVPGEESSTLPRYRVSRDYYGEERIQTPMLAISIMQSDSTGTFALGLLPTGAYGNEFRRIGLMRMSLSWFDQGFDMEVRIV